MLREGHTSLVRELECDLKEKPGAIVLSVGGGGLLNGVVEGLRRAGWSDVPIVAMETVGAHSLNAAVKAGELVTLPAITRYTAQDLVFLKQVQERTSSGCHDICLALCSVATTLGLVRVSAQTFKLVDEHMVFSEVVTDQEAVEAVERFVGE